MRHVALASLLLVMSCTPSAVQTATPIASVSQTAASATQTPVATAASPSAFIPQDLIADRRLYPAVTVSAGVFPIMTTLRLRLAVVDETVLNAAHFAVERYLANIDDYREGRSPALPITGPFLTAVSAALKESATPGVRRHFELESLTVDHHVQKPWGTHAYVEVTVGIADRAVGGTAPDQHEIGKLRLTGDRLMVTDGWDFEHDRWFNGFGPLPLEQVRIGVRDAVTPYLAAESWSPNAPATWSWGNETSAYQRERATRVLAIDRQQTTTRFFEGVTASIDQFETIDGIWSGLATVHVKGTEVTTSAAGQTVRTTVDRHVRVFLLGNWTPEVVDEQLATGEWASGGVLALDQVDVNRA
ncbi:MAG TPA: hypothetical protein VEZ15_10650 [Acidimicrobiia bacterium]|nr:hypothetical protein [Acidimicrobiia bacterium]